MDQSLELECATGSIVANVGDKFTDERKEWEIVGFQPRYDEMTVLCKPVDGKIPSHWKQWELEDHIVAWCDDSIAAILLTKADGKPRSARGDLLSTTVTNGDRA